MFKRRKPAQARTDTRDKSNKAGATPERHMTGPHPTPGACSDPKTSSSNPAPKMSGSAPTGTQRECGDVTVPSDLGGAWGGASRGSQEEEVFGSLAGVANSETSQRERIDTATSVKIDCSYEL